MQLLALRCFIPIGPQPCIGWNFNFQIKNYKVSDVFYLVAIIFQKLIVTVLLNWLQCDMKLIYGDDSLK